MALESFGASVTRVLETEEEDYVRENEDLACATRQAVSTLWNALSAVASSNAKTKSGKRRREEKRLYVDGFDVEQIWCQLDLQTPKLLKAVDRKLEKLKSITSIRSKRSKRNEEENEETEDAFLDDESENEDSFSEEEKGTSDTSGDESGSGDSAEYDEYLEQLIANPLPSSSEEDEGEGEEEEEKGKEEEELLPTEEGFFRLNQMEAFVQQAEEMYEKEMMSGEDEDESGEDFDDEIDDEDDEEELDEDGVRNLMYKDYFREGGKRGEEEEDEEEFGEERRVRFADDVKGESSDDGDESEDDFKQTERSRERDSKGSLAATEGEEGEEESKSRQELRSERMGRRIQRLEEANMSEAHWTMKGEVRSNQRPENSLLEVDLDFQHTSTPALEPTQELANELEDIIKARIKDGRFDDVIPIAAAEAPDDANTLNDDALDDKKSMKGLAEIYEAEYMQARGFSDIEDKQARKREACWTLYRSIAARLDAMSHFQFTPKPITEQASESAPNAPAVTMEEVGLEALSTAGTLAPSEVMKPSSKGLGKADGELEQGERKARRRSNKKRRKAQKLSEAESGEPMQKMGRKSVEGEQRKKKNKKKGMEDLNDKKVRYSKSGDVFKLLQEQQEAEKNPAGPASQRKTTSLRENKNALKL